MFDLLILLCVNCYMNGEFIKDDVEDSCFLEVDDFDLVDVMCDIGVICIVFDWNFIIGKDSGVDNLGGVGIGVLVIGLFFMMFVVLVLLLLIGVVVLIYFEEFVFKNCWIDLIEVNILNFVVVLLIVFGIFGLVVFI